MKLLFYLKFNVLKCTDSMSPLQPPVGILRYIMNGEIGEKLTVVITKPFKPTRAFKCTSYPSFLFSQSQQKALNMITCTSTSSWSCPTVSHIYVLDIIKRSKICSPLYLVTAAVILDWSSLPFQSLSGVTQTCRTKTSGKVSVLKESDSECGFCCLLNPQSFLCQQENVAFFSYPFNFEAFYMSEKESEGQS